ncbi:MAG: carbohydrate kinase [Acidimicrobiales bacterium]|nr:carbohydrate kinase [Acidimicrobiales bacterium]
MHRTPQLPLAERRSRPADAVRLDAGALARWPLPVDEAGDKHSRGTVLVIAGSAFTPGAAILAGIAALRMGAGRLQLATDAAIAPTVAVAVPESMVIPLPSASRSRRADRDRLDASISSCDAVLVGPGLMGEGSVDLLFRQVIDVLAPDATLVADAAALVAISGTDRDLLGRVRDRMVLTPNRQELEALVAADPESRVDGSPTGVACAMGAIVTSFGEVAAPDGRRWTTDPATPGLGTSGSGDVLAGLVVGAAARCRDAVQAACWATYVHEAAGNRLSERLGRTSFIARELLDEVPSVLGDIERRAQRLGST